MMTIEKKIRIFLMNIYSTCWFMWKNLISIKKHTLIINTVKDEILESHFCSFCEKILKVCTCFTDIVLSFEKRKEEKGLEILKSILYKDHNDDY